VLRASSLARICRGHPEYGLATRTEELRCIWALTRKAAGESGFLLICPELLNEVWPASAGGRFEESIKKGLFRLAECRGNILGQTPHIKSKCIFESAPEERWDRDAELERGIRSRHLRWGGDSGEGQAAARPNRQFCGLEAMTVQNAQWGPPLWRILHGLAERLGRQTAAILVADETRAWTQFLRATEAAMPCAMCRGHYREWRKQRPFEQIAAAASLGGEEYRNTARRWLWELHEAVNDRREVGAESRVDWLSLEETYRKQGIQENVEILLRLLQQAALEGQIDGAAVREWRGRLAMVRRLVGA
jgi:hypothetical protein